jgi:hypothetical protein
MEIVEGLCVEHRADVGYDSHVADDVVPVPWSKYIGLRAEACMNEAAVGCSFERKSESMNLSNRLRFRGVPLAPREFC